MTWTATHTSCFTCKERGFLQTQGTHLSLIVRLGYVFNFPRTTDERPFWSSCNTAAKRLYVLFLSSFIQYVVLWCLSYTHCISITLVQTYLKSTEEILFFALLVKTNRGQGKSCFYHTRSDLPEYSGSYMFSAILVTTYHRTAEVLFSAILVTTYQHTAEALFSVILVKTY